MDDAAGSIGQMFKKKKKKARRKAVPCYILWDLPDWVAIPPLEAEQTWVPWQGALH